MTIPDTWVEVRRDILALEIPSGSPVPLPRGSRVAVRQALGGTFTLLTERGSLVRIGAEDADAIGREPPKATVSSAAPPTREAVERRVWEELRTCFDPEIPMNIVDLGLVYASEVEPRPQGGFAVRIAFTLTAPGCGMGEVLKGDIEARLGAIPGVDDVRADVVFDPVWTRDRMSEEARVALNLL